MRKGKDIEKTKEIAAKKYYYGKGRRKEATATVRVYEGVGDDIINNKKVSVVCKGERERSIVYMPLKVIDSSEKFYFTSKVKGGGKIGQLYAVRLALARAISKVSEEFNKILKSKNLLSVDDRVKERKKPGLKKARKKEQYSKR